MRTTPRLHAQAFVEYGLLVAVAVILTLAGLSLLQNAATTYMAHTEPTPNAAVLGGLPLHKVTVKVDCPNAPSQSITGITAIGCTVTVTDLTTGGSGGQVPTGSITFLPTPDATISDCPLSGISGNVSKCDFTYKPTNLGPQSVKATYQPTSNHQPGSDTRSGFTSAVDQTTTTLTCPPTPVPVGEPAQCELEVDDLYPARAGPINVVGVDVTTNGNGTFSRVGELSNGDRGSFPCDTSGANAPCTLFRSDALRSELGAHDTLAARFMGLPDYYQASPAPSVQVVTVATTPPQHSVSVSVKCDAGSQQSPLQINQAGASTTCTATVTDTAPPDANGNPRQITPTGTVSWSSSADNGGKSTWPPNPSCTLQRVDDSKAQCQTTYTPTSIGTPPGPNYVDTQHVSAHFNGDGFIHTVPSDSPPTDGVVYVTDQHPVQIDVSCTPGNVRSQPLVIGAVPANDTSQCTVTVTDIAKTGSLVAPTGQVKWSNSSLGTGGAGTFGATSSCTLPPPSANSAQAQCSVTYQATAMGNPDQTDPLPINTHTITAAYQGDWLHPANDPSSKNLGPGKVFVANIHPVTVAVTCPDLGSSAANPLPRGQTTTCFASVTDTSSAPLAPTGTVILSESPDGPSTLTPGSCSLTAFSSLEARCSFDYRPTPPQDPNSPATGVDTHYITGTYSPTDGLHPAGNNNPGQPVYVRPH